MSVISESEESTVKYKRLQFVEMLEMIGRIAECKYKENDIDRDPLVTKMEWVLDDVLALVDVKRKDVNILVDE